jgi:hypothetical protein
MPLNPDRPNQWELGAKKKERGAKGANGAGGANTRQGKQRTVATKKKATLDNGQWPTATPLDAKNPAKY